MFTTSHLNDDVVRTPSKSRSYGPHAWKEVSRVIELPNPAYEPASARVSRVSRVSFPSTHEHVYPDTKGGGWSRDEGQ